MASLRVRQILLEVLAFDQPEPPAEGSTIWDRLCASAAKAVPVTGAGVALMTPRGHGGTLAATDRSALALEDLQQTLGEGPCVNAFHDRRPVLQPDLAEAASRWPGFTPGALDAGVAAIFAFPLQVGAIRLGVLDLYRDTPGPLDALQLTEALDYAAAATTIMLDLQQVTSAGELHPDLADAADDHREIHQATGMITVQAAVTINEALLLLRARAYADGQRLRELAQEVVARQVTFYPEDDHHE
ncbi:GAF and ANTAR domain-containing protein [Streptomyces sp. SID13031]|uniref:GAF and ANTAR domain-containing protein n=1 Tax=Streptomyces sp. SID13031 TaxID=2706046 RepID=UPI0013CA8240|nr:GAF and ANTAR domain-containing protein [Streptomyces sp. SID13031]NEA35812.1 GAF and ANTAR domain-containing protein [Streptomyces sp. SID13031]